MSARWDVLGFGAVAVDDLLYVDQYPAPDSKVPVVEERRAGGGLAGTALVAAARLGARAAYCGVLGDDELSQFTIQELEREGVNCTPVLRHEGARPIHSRIIVERSTAQRSILFSMAGVTPRRPEEMSEELIASCRVLFVDHTVIEGGLRAIELAHVHGIPVVGDIERDAGPRLPELMRQIDHLIVGVQFARRATGAADPPAMVRVLSSAGRACAVVTLGDHGCYYAERGGEVQHFPAFKVQVVDTTGCGDVFHGAYAACIARGEEVRTAIRVATAAAGIKATRPGGRAGIPDRAAVERFLSRERGEGHGTDETSAKRER
jgi:sugar/nucleoside kinase (ribokinase family)